MTTLLQSLMPIGTWNKAPATFQVNYDEKRHGIGIISLSPCDENDPISSTTYVPLKDYSGSDEERMRFFRETVQGTADFTAPIFGRRKKHWGDDCLRGIQKGILETLCYPHSMRRHATREKSMLK